jgi:hypothetical protein
MLARQRCFKCREGAHEPIVCRSFQFSARLTILTCPYMHHRNGLCIRVKRNTPLLRLLNVPSTHTHAACNQQGATNAVLTKCRVSNKLPWMDHSIPYAIDPAMHSVTRTKTCNPLLGTTSYPPLPSPTLCTFAKNPHGAEHNHLPKNKQLWSLAPGMSRPRGSLLPWHSWAFTTSARPSKHRGQGDVLLLTSKRALVWPAVKSTPSKGPIESLLRTLCKSAVSSSPPQIWSPWAPLSDLSLMMYLHFF